MESFGFEYYPLEEGGYIEYQVLQYVYDDFDNSIDTLNYILREIIDSAFLDGENRLAYALRRQTRVNDTLAWDLQDIWTITPGSDHLERMEENISYVKLVFPLRQGATWDGNVRNSLPTETYQIMNLDFQSQYGSRSGEICRVNVRNNVNLIEEQVREEVYAKNVGLVQVYDKDVRKNPDGTILSGTVTTYEYRSHGIQ